jgi:SAM-dependent MidA family methyltransferase
MPSQAESHAHLPLPDDASVAHSAEVAEFIRRRIMEAGGSISFAEFMQLALYAPGLGYYSAGAAKLGAGGDFITSPEISPLFARVLARQCAQVLQALPARCVLELGAGSGLLAAGLLECLPRHGIELSSYAILEVSADLRQRQHDLLHASVPEHAAKVEWLDCLPESYTGVVIANEVADALPVERFEKFANEVFQQRVTVDNGRFSWAREKAPPFLKDAVLHLEQTLGVTLPDGYVSEISTALPAWIGDIASSLDCGFIFLFDYGVSRREYYARDRSDGWLRCHFRHHAHSDPFIHAGIQDLSAWVDFTAVAEGATNAGLDIAGFVTQAQFLMRGGLEEEMAGFEVLPTAAQLELARQVKILTLPSEMGEHFKCIGLSRNQTVVPASFGYFDKAHTL